eukprot:3696234-Pyramimonas_sp.AAC.1
MRPDLQQGHNETQLSLTQRPCKWRRGPPFQYLPYCRPAVCPHEHVQLGPITAQGICDHTEASRPCRDS